MTGIELSPAMLASARRRAAEPAWEVDLRVGDAEALDFEDAAFDTVVRTFSLCAIPDQSRSTTDSPGEWWNGSPSAHR